MKGISFCVGFVTLLGQTGLVLARPGVAQGNLLWLQTLKGTAEHDEALSVAVDHQGNVVAAGSTWNTGTDDLDFTVAKFDRDGTLLWQQTLSGTDDDSNDGAYSVAVDHQGNVVAAGSTLNTGTESDFTVAKFDCDGTLLWLQTLNGTDNFIDWAGSVAVDNHGNVVAAGSTWNTGTFSDFTVAKFDRNGTLLWQQSLSGTDDYSEDRASSVAVDHQGNVVAAGTTLNTGTGPGDFTVAKFDRDGTLLWLQTLDGAGNYWDVANSVAVDNQGNVVAAGRSWSAVTGAEFTVAKFDRDGTLLWLQTLNGTAVTRGDEALSVAVDNRGNVVAAGRTGNTDAGFSDFTVAKFDRDGTLIWLQTLDGTRHYYADDWAGSVAVDHQGNVVAAGTTVNTGTGFDFTVAAFDPEGTLLWLENLTPSANYYDAANSVAVDHQGNVVAVGRTNTTLFGIDFTVAKFAGGGGSDAHSIQSSP